MKIEKYFLHLAGEYRVCSELIKRGVFATVTYGNRKGVDVYVISDKKEMALKIEGKTSQYPKFVTSIGQKKENYGLAAPDYWVLFYLKRNRDASFKERFFVLSHQEICRLQKQINDEYAKKYQAKHGKRPEGRGVDNVKLDVRLLPYENQWSKIIDRIGRVADPLSSRGDDSE